MLNFGMIFVKNPKDYLILNMKNFLPYQLLLLFFCGTILISCNNDPDPPVASGPNLIFKFRFDPTQERLNNFGLPASVPAGHAGQSPSFNGISANYIEMTTSIFTALGGGEIVYEGPETSAGGSTAIDFSKATVVAEDEVFLSIPLSEVTPDTYHHLRVSLSYQNYDITFRAAGIDWTGTIASFVGYNNYITNYQIKEETITENANKLQGYWGFEYSLGSFTGQAPEGATTVPNPLFATSPVPAGSCVVSGEFDGGFTITGEETEDVTVIMSVSNNNSFEWTDGNGNGIYEPLESELPVDMGLRGLVPTVE